jgi:superfamily II DNA or RNA helicase
MTRNRDDIQRLALEAIGNKQRCGIGVSMGVGKTLIGLMHMAKNYTDYAKFLVVAPKRSIFQSWIDDAQKFNLEYLLDNIEFSTYISLPKQSLEQDIVYLDECHSLLYSHEPWLSLYTGKILGLTGTPPKMDTSEKGEMVAQFCPIVYTYVVDSAVDDSILNDYRIIMHPIELDTKKSLKVESKGSVWFTSESASYDYWTNRLENAKTNHEERIMRIMRMRALMNFPSKEHYAKQLLSTITDKCIVFVNTHEQADRICSHSHHANNPKSEDNLEKFKRGEIMKLSAVLQLSEGVNIPELSEGIILHSYGNERKSAQRIGRLLRLNPEELATIHILYYPATIDELWARKALEDFDKDKITWKHARNIN